VEFAEWRQKDLKRAVESVGAIDDAVADSRGIIMRKLIPCGKECGGCPDGANESVVLGRREAALGASTERRGRIGELRASLKQA
jgi:bacterioferritin-associated ferredoxin